VLRKSWRSYNTKAEQTNKLTQLSMDDETKAKAGPIIQLFSKDTNNISQIMGGS
jgi:hypothetical protein